MHAPDAFYDLPMLLLIAMGAAAVFLRPRLPAVPGYLVVGLAVGPSAFALVQDVDTIRSLAELGVMPLLFTIGLEFSLSAVSPPCPPRHWSPNNWPIRSNSPRRMAAPLSACCCSRIWPWSRFS